MNSQPQVVADRMGVQPKISHAFLLTSAQLARGLLRVLFALAAARVLGPERFGIYTLLLAMVEMLAMASGTGYIDYLTREAAIDERLGWGLGEQLIGVRVAILAPFVAVGVGIFWFLGYPQIVLAATALMSLSLFPRSLSEAVQGVLRGISRYSENLVIELASGLTLATGAVLLLVRGGGLRIVIATEIIAAIVAAIAALIFAAKYRTRQRLRLPTSQVVKTGAIFNIYGFVANLYDRVDILLLSRLAGDYATGVYGAAYRPIGAVQLLPYGVLYSLLPALSRGNYSGAERQRLEKAMGILLDAAFVIVLVTMVFAGPAVKALLGTRFAESALALKILIWAVILRYVNYALNVRLLAGGHERVFVVTSLICLGTNIVGNFAFIPFYGWKAAAGITIVTESALLVQNAYWLRRTVGSLPKPCRWERTSIVFVVIVGVALAGARLSQPLLIGGACVLTFIFYLWRTGTIEDFAAVWNARRTVEELSS